MKYLELSFWIALGFLIYTYILYPWVLFLLSHLFRFRSKSDESFEPTVALLVAACNEEAVIRHKIENALALSYSKDKLEIWIGSDGSDDGTDNILKSFGTQIHYMRIDPRQGKSNVLNHLATKAQTEVFVFSDANTMFESDAIQKLVRHLADARVGGVCGQLRLEGNSQAMLGQLERQYWRLESVLKRWEGAMGRVMGSNGAIYAVRREQYRPIPIQRLLMDDFYITLCVLRQGKKVVYETEAFATEGLSVKDVGEFNRKVRIARANFNFVWTQLGMLFTIDLLFPFLFVSHKLMRWFSPWLMLALLAINSILANESIYRAFFVGQLAFYFVGLIGVSLHKVVKPLAAPYYFLSMNAAMFLGFWKSLSAKQEGSWKRVRREI